MLLRQWAGERETCTIKIQSNNHHLLRCSIVCTKGCFCMRAESSRVESSRSSSVRPYISFGKQYLYDVYKSFEKCTLEWKCQAITYETINLFSVYPWIAAHVCRTNTGSENNFCLEHVRVCIHGPASTSTHTRALCLSYKHTKLRRRREIGRFFILCRIIASPMRNWWWTHELWKQKQKFPYRLARTHHVPTHITHSRERQTKQIHDGWNITVNRKQRESNTITHKYAPCAIPAASVNSPLCCCCCYLTHREWERASCVAVCKR